MEFADANPEKAERTVVFIGRAGALYPFFRVSALLKHFDGRMRNVPVVLLYPGDRKGDAGLSFMGELAPDRDYRPQIYHEPPHLFESDVTRDIPPVVYFHEQSPQKLADPS